MRIHPCIRNMMKFPICHCVGENLVKIHFVVERGLTITLTHARHTYASGGVDFPLLNIDMDFLLQMEEIRKKSKRWGCWKLFRPMR